MSRPGHRSAVATPLSTYRLQLSKDFGFDDAARIVPYLKSLGITHLYTSPFLKARAGSRHGYDAVDYRALNPEFGGEEAFVRLSTALKEAELGLILDFVPNHMAVGSDNAWWMDVLEWGQKSPRAASFDISWELLPYRRGGGVLLPVLGKPYGEALTAGEIALKYDADEGSFSAWYFDHRFPINPQRYSDIIKTVVAAAHAAEEPAGHDLLALANEHARPGSPSYRQAPELKQRLAGIEGAASIIERGLSAYGVGQEIGVGALHRLLERQHYRLADWRLAVSGINYRRFFDINELAALRVEDARTFRDMHELIARLIAADQLQGLRLDHIDGLLDPMQYTRRLQQMIRSIRGGDRRKPFYVVVEKILADSEPMPAFPGIAGTTGYEWLNAISRVLVDQTGREKLDALWREISPAQRDFATVLERSKLRVLSTIMASEFNVLTQLLSRIAAGHFSTRDYSADRLREALRLYILEFPLYRTYVTAVGCGDNDRAIIDRTIAAARRRWLGTDRDIFVFLRDALTLDLIGNGLPYSRSRVRKFALKMQQFTGPMAAKSVEDTALYRYHALLGLNEVGGDPTLPALSVTDFHVRMARRAEHFPHGLTATATHDTKRGEDARTRILALSELPELWTEHVANWQRLNAQFATSLNVRRSPSPEHEYMLYQALVGAWPAAPIDARFVQRIEDYALKAAREGKLETSWLNPDEDYEQASRSFVRAILDRGRAGEFLDSFDSFSRRAVLLGALNSLTQLVLKATMPGVPDFYQGTEDWDLSLVDPDNRRPVDFASRQAALAADTAPDWQELASHWMDGRIKLALTHRLLSLRNAMPALFRDGAYEPVEVTGPHREHILAFRRSTGRDCVVVAVGRHFGRMTDGGNRWPAPAWQADLNLDRPQRAGLRDALGGAALACDRLEISSLFAALPVAVLRNS
jgi:(1->4)-alpha-D-glucan 1-alpha-D-glucosylmutase